MCLVKELILRKIKILVLNINDLGGIERVALNLFNMFKQTELYSNVEIVSVCGDVALSNFKYLKGSSEQSKLIEFAKALDENTVVLSLYDRFSIKLSLIRKVYSLKFRIYACQHADYYAHPILTRILRLLTYRWVDKIIALTSEDGSIYDKLFKNVHVIPNVLSFYPESVSSFSNRNISCAVAGRLVPIKQYDHFVEFLNKVKLCGLNDVGVYRVFGDGSETRRLEKLLNDFGLRSSDILVGKVSNIEEQLCDTRFFFVTSLRESFSMVILEAMACGCIVISYDCPTGPRELINNGYNGFLVPINDREALFSCYIKLLSNPDACQRISNNAREYSKRFLEENIVKQWVSVLHE